MYAYVGSRTTRERHARGERISVLRVDARSGALTLVQVVKDLVNPSYRALSASGSHLYTLHGDQSEVSAFWVDRDSGALRLLNRQSTEGRNPVHLALDPGGQHLVVTNHIGASVVVLPIEPDGALGPLAQNVPFSGPTGPHRVEQQQAKPHFNLFDPAGRFVIVPDKGPDRVLSFRFAAGRLTDRLTAAAAPCVQAREGAGPRCLVFHPRRPLAYVVNELDSTLTTYAFDPETGGLAPRQIVSTLPSTFTGHSRAAGTTIDANGRTVYCRATATSRARVHPDLDLGFLMSPPLVIALALAGATPSATSAPSRCRSRPAAAPCICISCGRRAKRSLPILKRRSNRRTSGGRSPSPARTRSGRRWLPRTRRCSPWDPKSTALRRPPFASVDQGSQLGRYIAQPLLVLGDDITTDHISPASAIPPGSLVADYLVARGDDRHDLNVFASRRGNWEMMVRAAFHSKSLVNLLQPGVPVAHTLHVPSGAVQPIWDVAERYRAAGQTVVLVAGERYGTGSSRDWAAKGQRLFGIRAVLAVSFERIHRSNLIGMGILPLRLPAGVTPEILQLLPGDRIEVDAPAAAMSPRGEVTVSVHRLDGQVQTLQATAAVETQREVALLRDGGVIPAILRQSIPDGST